MTKPPTAPPDVECKGVTQHWCGQGMLGGGRATRCPGLLGLGGSEDARHPALKPGQFQADRDSHPRRAELLYRLALLREARVSARACPERGQFSL